MRTRLETNAPALARFAAASAPTQRNRAAIAALEAALPSFPEVAVSLRLCLATADAETAAVLAERLDGEYFALEEAGKDSSAKFSQARIAMGVKFALEGAAEEALYEATIATNSVASIEAAFEEALRNEA